MPKHQGKEDHPHEVLLCLFCKVVLGVFKNHLREQEKKGGKKVKGRGRKGEEAVNKVGRRGTRSGEEGGKGEQRVNKGGHLSDPTEIPPPYRETGVAIPLSHCVSCGIADYRCYTRISFLKHGYRNPKTGLTRGGIADKACL